MTSTLQFQKHPHAPAGCDGYLTRRQAARALGFSSEFKIRQFEKEGVLHSVRGPMRAAFYPREEILALKAQLALREPAAAPENEWTDAELIALLRHPTRAGQPRTALDLVLETQISIERAERVCCFLAASEATPAPQPARPARASADPAVAIARRRSSNAVSTSFRSALASSPIALRSAAGTAFSWLRIALSSPLLPRMVAFSLRSACSVVAPLESTAERRAQGLERASHRRVRRIHRLAHSVRRRRHADGRRAPR